MKNKSVEALLTGFILWIFGVSAVLLFGNSKPFSTIAVPVSFLTAPAIYYLTRFHLRNVNAQRKSAVAVQFGVIITLVQFPLDILIWLSSFNLGFPSFSQKTTQTIIIGLLIAYFLMLAVPWLISKRIVK